MPKSRLEYCLALKKFLEYAVAEHRQPQEFLISEKDYLEDRGADSKRRKKAVLTDTEVLELIGLLPETWGNVIKICLVFGVRSREVAFINRATNEDGEPQLRVTKGKTYNTRSGVKEETDPRWLEAVAVDGTTFDLVKGWDQLKLPPTVSGKSLGAVLRRLPLLAGADGRIRSQRRVAAAVLTAGDVLSPGSRDREGRHLDRRGHGPHRRSASPQLQDNRVEKRSGSFCAS